MNVGFAANRRERQERRDLYGVPGTLDASPLGLLAALIRYGRLGRCIWQSRRIQGWIRGQEAVSLARAASGLPRGAVVVEIGSFLGCSTVILAGARKLHGSGVVHAIDPFSASGDAFSTPIYRQIASASSLTLRQRFEANLRRAGVSEWVEVHQATAAEAAAGWGLPIDMLYLDGDQSPRGAREAFMAWEPFLKEGGVLAINNSAEGSHPPDHDGSLRVVREFVVAPAFEGKFSVEALTFATKAG